MTRRFALATATALAAMFCVPFGLGLRGAHADPPSPARPTTTDAGVRPAPVGDRVTDPRETPPVPVRATRCREQRARPELIRANYISAGGSSDQERERGRRRRDALRYRTEHYGFFPGFGEAAWNSHPPMHYASWTEFMGLRVRIHRAVVPALACVEREIQRSCAAHPYRPGKLVGIRPNNSFRGGEVSNHVYGIAIDIDPDRNPCCGCGGAFARHPSCTRRARSTFERMQMPECWVRAFERYGFYWLGNDRALRDTMHFEFLGDPDAIAEGRRL